MTDLGKARAPNYILIAPHTFGISPMDSKTLEAGTFVRPIELCYVPKHVLEDKRWRGIGPDFVFAYTRYGIIPILKSRIKEVG